ncbi:hypothetical protein JQ596_09680 [Bradyrhizobium manausense]|uniref:hypothetical protein n=1 Tax=Bradyrhizobium manausense TaxID=989370 RepID=UPI001BAC0D21|nr:hypothetical protein [Bradyrhizobium manausense]MBR0825806.1 hypothetical protein [Bradyrhizobium manausense]
MTLSLGLYGIAPRRSVAAVVSLDGGKDLGRVCEIVGANAGHQPLVLKLYPASRINRCKSRHPG